MSMETFQFMDTQSLKVFVDALFDKTNIRINERIVTSIDENSNDKHVASAAALNLLMEGLIAADPTLEDRVTINDSKLVELGGKLANLETKRDNQDTNIGNLEDDLDELTTLTETLTHLTISIVTGAIDTVTTPEKDVLYFQQDDENDNTWMLYIYTDNGWVNVGDTAVDLSGYWNKDDINELQGALNVHFSEAVDDEDIEAAVNEAFDETTPNLGI